MRVRMLPIEGRQRPTMKVGLKNNSWDRGFCYVGRRSMNIVALRNFVRVVDLGNVSKAAQAIHIAQPALSRQLRALEEELGVQLVIRHSWGVAPTRAGAVLASSARRILNDIASVRMEVRAAEHEPAGLVSVGATPSLAATFFYPLTTRLLQKYPKICLRLTERMSSDLANELHRGRTDLGIVQKNRALTGLKADFLLTEHVALVGRPDLVAGVGPVTWDAFRNLPLILPTAPSDARSALDIAFGDAEIHIAAEIDGLPTMLQMVAHGLGFALLTRSACEKMVASGEVALSPLQFPWPQRDVVVARGPNRPRSRAALAVYDELQHLAAELSDRFEWHLEAPVDTDKMPVVAEPAEV